ncbi:hypothetical protein HPC49_53990 [Pyxidicoccus fallax]|uniref:Uncharacterized protein n=1 Tax=Pyxidicoccus fallax TaxID=394095 RepID=A0A848LZG7_9BACT|nr:hypothetical protein [Pyxidicoccus fallax]NMO23618.1 hypothetical protein [Pyxidicoccus fallax]NPC87080.1 hypothetical protein [Pyxidicoccus fallax]
MAGSSFKVMSKVRYKHILELRQAGAAVEVHFDGSHSLATKPAHFELNITIRDRMSLVNLDSAITQMFGFFTQEVNLTNRVKYEVALFDEDLIDRSTRSYEIRAAIDTLNDGGVADFIANVL